MRIRTIGRTAAVLLTGVLSMAAAGCGDDAGASTTVAAPAPTTGAAAGPATTVGADAATTVGTAGATRSIEHTYGTAVVPADPQRVVALGLTDQDYLLALGVVPVGIRDWFGEQPNAVWPWARSYLNGAEPELLSRELNFEAIAALKPDLITAVYGAVTEEEYQLLNAIAPTVTQPAGLEGGQISWQEQTRFTGEILGRTAEARAIVEALEGKIDGAVAAHPEFAGLEYAFASVYEGEYYLFGAKNSPAKFLERLGFVLPERPLQLAANENDYFVFTGETMDVVDRELVLWTEGVDDAGVAELLADPLYANLAVHTEGRDIFLGTELYGGAFSFSTVLSLDLLVDDLVPALALAVDGDPVTDPVLAG